MTQYKIIAISASAGGSEFVCPDCGGILWEKEMGNLHGELIRQILAIRRSNFFRQLFNLN